MQAKNDPWALTECNFNGNTSNIFTSVSLIPEMSVMLMRSRLEGREANLVKKLLHQLSLIYKEKISYVLDLK